MNNYRKSDYAVNKFSEGIVYRFNSETIEVTLEDYLKENPGKTEQDFQKLKAISVRCQRTYAICSVQVCIQCHCRKK